jgi:hypothetical protein
MFLLLNFAKGVVYPAIDPLGSLRPVGLRFLPALIFAKQYPDDFADTHVTSPFQ